MSHFFRYWSPSFSYCRFLDAILFDIGEGLSINPSVDVIVFGDFNVNYKSCLTYSGETDRHGELYHNCFVFNDLTQMVSSPTWIPDCDFHSPAFLDLFISTD